MPIPTSPTQFAAFERGDVPGPERVAEHLWSIPLPLPAGQGSGGVRYTLCYLLRDAHGRAHLVDPGWGTPLPLDLVERGLAAAGASLGDVASILVTHMHPDHLGGADQLRHATGAPLVMHEEEQLGIRRRAAEGVVDAQRLDTWGVPADRRPELQALTAWAAPMTTIEADHLLRDGEALDDLGIEAPGLDLGFVRTPGHTPGSLCIVDRIAGVVMTGDHVLPHIYPGLGLGGSTPTDPIADYLVALERVSIYDEMEVAPGHGYRFRGLAERCLELAAHHERRNAEVAVALQELGGEASVWDVASRIRWSRGFENMRGFFLGSALSQTQMHIARLHGERL